MKKTILIFLFSSFFIYTIVVYTDGTKGSNVAMSNDAKEGKQIFQKYNCSACHQLYGLGGFLGPELTTVISDSTRGEIYAMAILRSGTSRMPQFHLKDKEIDQLISFLKYVDTTAISYKKINNEKR